MRGTEGMKIDDGRVLRSRAKLPLLQRFLSDLIQDIVCLRTVLFFALAWRKTVELMLSVARCG